MIIAIIVRVLGGTTEEGLRGILMHEARCCYCHFTLNAQVDGVFTGVLRVHKLGVSVLAEITNLRKRKKEKTNCNSEGVAKPKKRKINLFANTVVIQSLYIKEQTFVDTCSPTHSKAAYEK